MRQHINVVRWWLGMEMLCNFLRRELPALDQPEDQTLTLGSTLNRLGTSCQLTCLTSAFDPGVNLGQFLRLFCIHSALLANLVTIRFVGPSNSKILTLSGFLKFPFKFSESTIWGFEKGGPIKGRKLNFFSQSCSPVIFPLACCLRTDHIHHANHLNFRAVQTLKIVKAKLLPGPYTFLVLVPSIPGQVSGFSVRA